MRKQPPAPFPRLLRSPRCQWPGCAALLCELCAMLPARRAAGEPYQHTCKPAVLPPTDPPAGKHRRPWTATASQCRRIRPQPSVAPPPPLRACCHAVLKRLIRRLPARLPHSPILPQPACSPPSVKPRILAQAIMPALPDANFSLPGGPGATAVSNDTRLAVGAVSLPRTADARLSIALPKRRTRPVKACEPWYAEFMPPFCCCRCCCCCRRRTLRPPSS